MRCCSELSWLSVSLPPRRRSARLLRAGRYIPDYPFFGPFVLVTSAYSKLSDWPGGGLAGIHGTDQPGLLGQAVSHGCVRVANAVALELERLAPLGTPVDLLR
jgi:lipoprotein-anchoring transpeptidase ErfK/SrfK